MGLDVNLYRYEDLPAYEKLEEEFERKTDPLYKDESLSVETRAEQVALIAGETGLVKGKYGWEPPGCLEIRQDSPKYPEHLFKIGYFRSSYNDGGINRVLENMSLPTLYEVFNPGEHYRFAPDWEQAKDVIGDLREKFDITASRKYAVMHEGKNIFTQDKHVSSEAEALRIFMEQQETVRDYAYSNNRGWFSPHNPLKVVGLIPGVKVVGLIPGVNSIGSEGCFVIYEREDENMKWYDQALEIVEDTIDYVLAQDQPEKFALHWSG